MKVALITKYFPIYLFDANNRAIGKASVSNAKPRLVRQQAVVQEEVVEPSSTSPKLSVRFLPTIPSAADSSVIIDEESHNEPSSTAGSANNNVGSSFYTILQSGNTLTTLSSPKSNKLEKPP